MVRPRLICACAARIAAWACACSGDTRGATGFGLTAGFTTGVTVRALRARARRFTSRRMSRSNRSSSAGSVDVLDVVACRGGVLDGLVGTTVGGRVADGGDTLPDPMPEATAMPFPPKWAWRAA